MSTRLTVYQYRVLEFIAVIGHTQLLPMHWRDRTHQALIRGGHLRLRADPFKTKAGMLKGWITAKGRKAVASASEAVKAQAKRDADRDYNKFAVERYGGDE